VNTLFDIAEQLISDFLDGIKAELLQYMADNDRNATGKSAASLRVEVEGMKGALIGGDWLQYTFRGRRPGGMPPLSQIIDWCNARGIPRSKAWIIAKTISEKGTKLYQQGGFNNNALLTALSTDKLEAFKKQIFATFTARLKTDIGSVLGRAA